MDPSELSNSISSPINNEESTINNNYTKTIAKYCVLIGISIFTSIFVTNLVKTNLKYFFASIGQIDETTIFYMMFAAVIIIEGIGIYKRPSAYVSKDQNIKQAFISLLNFIKKDLWLILLSVMPYIILSTFVLYYLTEPQQVRFMLHSSAHKSIWFHLIPIFIIYYELFKVSEGVFVIFKRSVKDSKDRLSIVIAILATLVSGIALFK